MRNIVRTACLLALLGITPAHGFERIKRYVPRADTVGSGRLSVMFWDVYDARLLAPDGDWQPTKPFALQLSYLRAISAERIANRSIAEMRTQGFDDEIKMADWHAQMSKIFPDVQRNTSLTGIYTQDGQTIFLGDGQELGRIKDPEFGIHFFDIWLSQKTTAPELRQQLLGQE